MSSETDCTLDQWLTSAAAAMKFAAENWQAFCEDLERTTGPVPITAKDMYHHAMHLLDLVDPDRMPS